MTSRTLAVATIAAALLWSCSNDGGDADPAPDDPPAANSPTSAPGTTAVAGPQDSGSDAAVRTGITSGWSAEITGGQNLELPSAGGPAVLVSRTPAQTTLTGMVGQSGSALTIGLQAVEVGENRAHDFNLGFRTQGYRCISQDVVVTLTQLEPKPKGTFSGPVRCEDLADGADPIEATVSGEIAG